MIPNKCSECAHAYSVKLIDKWVLVCEKNNNLIRPMDDDDTVCEEFEHDKDKPVPPSNARKDDEGKLRMDLIPPEALFAMAEVLDYGASKAGADGKGYGERNWEKGMSAPRLYAAAQRHLIQWWAGSKNDDESGLSHLWHAMTNIAFMISLYERDKLDMNGSPHESP
jgi:hypothetical protein